MADDSFQELIRRVRAGDQDAASDLVRRYEPAIRRAVRVRLADSRLERAFDSMDICQSVLASFFMRAALGQYDLETPQQLMGLLAKMARNKLIDQVDRQQAQRRDHRRMHGASLADGQVAAKGSTPSQQLAARELLDEVKRRLSPEEFQLIELRAEGLDWESIAQQLGKSAEAVRKRFARATDRISQDLGIDA